jgi:hypothetical protein
MGRHSAADDDTASDAVSAGASAAGRAMSEPEVAAKQTPTQADLRLLRTEAGLRAQCAAAVVVPFLLYTLVLVAVSRTDVYLVWLWIPTVLAGVLVGSFLDRAHDRAGR